MQPEASVAAFSLAKEERAKTVTFSEPEDEELSDNSSICQSPSWEQYGQKKKKPKKGAHEKSTNGRGDKALKKKSNRLTKSPPIEQFATKPLTTSDCSISALEISSAAQSDAMSPPSSTAEAQSTQGKHQAPRNDLGSVGKDKPKSRGFLSAFRLTHGNVTAAQKLVEARREAEKSVESNESLRSIQYETIPVQQQKTARPGIDQNIPQPRNAPSIRSVISTSDHSLSSQEKRSSAARTSTGSGHGRSQSLLSSTLNKLRGPSYLYYQHSGEGSTSSSSKHSSGAQDIKAVYGNLVDVSTDGAEKASSKRELASFDHSQQPSDFAFPPKNRRANTEPGPEIAPRGRQPRSRKVEVQSNKVEQGIAVSKPSDSRRAQAEILQASPQDAVMALITAQERQSQTARTSPQARSHINQSKQVAGPMKNHPSGGIGIDAKRNINRNQNSEVRWPKNPPTATNTHLGEWLIEGEGMAMADSRRNGRPDVGNSGVHEDDQISVDTYASTVRPASRSRDGLAEGERQLKLSRADGLGPRTQGMEPWRFEDRPEGIVEKSTEELITFDKDAPDTSQHSLQPNREADYFASFSDSYLTPSLDPRSPNNGEILSSRSTISDESDEGNGHDILHDHLQDIYTQQIAVEGEGERTNQSGGTSNEQKPKNSPATSIQYSDSDVPAFERLGVSSTAAKVLGGVETASTSTAQSQQTEPSRTTSERSSSSTYGDSPPSPSSATTPDSSRPQSRKGVAISRSESSQVPIVARAEGSTIRPTLVATPTSVSFADALRQESESDDEQSVGQGPIRPLPPKAHSAFDLHSAIKMVPHSSRYQRLHSKQNGASSSVSLSGSPSPDVADEVTPRKSALKTSLHNSTSGPDSLTASSTGAAYLQEARRAAPGAAASSSRALRPHFSQNKSSGSIRSVVSTGNRAEPLAKILVECCNCHFFHDMPSRVYECMAKPDSVVEDKSLGVSAAITTMVKCPWCAHGMTTRCCPGYAAVVYLKEKLHGR